MLPHSEACVRNQTAILDQLAQIFTAPGQLLEIGSGTGQHAVYFGAHLPHLVWHTSDLPAHHAGIRAWLDHAALPNVLPPLMLDVETADWGSAGFDGVFSANTLHIMGWPQVQAFFVGVGRVLKAGGKLVVYGPFNYNGQFTSDSNRQFDQSLRQRDVASGIRDFAAVDALAQQHGLTLLADHAMPANNRLLVWQRDN
jgi:cyclopropane fatty-acyl-phospholipid synthase-like methyltransferase